MCVWPHLVGDRTCFLRYPLSCLPLPTHPQSPYTLQELRGSIAFPQMGTCTPWVVMTAHHTWPPWRSTSPRCITHPYHSFLLSNAGWRGA